MPGDVRTAGDGSSVEFSHVRDGRPVHVVPQATLWKQAAAVVMFIMGGFGTLMLWGIDARTDQRIAIHAADPQAHVNLVRVVDSQIASDKAKDTEIRRLAAQIDALQRDVRDLREAIVELKTVLNRSRSGSRG